MIVRLLDLALLAILTYAFWRTILDVNLKRNIKIMFFGKISIKNKKSLKKLLLFAIFLVL